MYLYDNRDLYSEDTKNFDSLMLVTSFFPSNRFQELKYDIAAFAAYLGVSLHLSRFSSLSYIWQLRSLGYISWLKNCF